MFNKFSTGLVFGFALLSCGLCPALTEYYVATTGSNAQPGTLAQPFATLAKARDAVRADLAAGETSATVYIRGGVYVLDQTVVFGLQDSTAGRVTYRAYADEVPIFSGGKAITGWTKVTSPLDGLPAASDGKIWVAEMPTGLGKFTTLFFGTTRLPRSRSANMWGDPAWNDANAAAVLNPGPGLPIRSHIYLKAGFGRSWPNLSDIELLSRGINWSENGYLPLKTINLTARYAETAAQGTYKLEPWNAGNGGTPTDPYAYFENATDYLDSENDWCVNTQTRKIYIYKNGTIPPADIVVPHLTELIRVGGTVEGLVDHEAMFLGGQTSPADVPVRGLTFEGLTFKHGERGYFQNETMIQHWWDGYDKANALMRFRGAENCIVRNCRFAESGGNGLRFDFYSMDNQVVGNEFANLGMSAVLVLGYGPGSKDVSKRNRIVNNHIHDCGELIAHSQMIVICQSGENQIAHNLIREVPRKAICLTGPRVPQFRMVDTNNDGVIDEFGKGVREWDKSMRWHEILPADTRTNYARLSGEANHYDLKAHTVFKYLHSRSNMVEYNQVTRACRKLNDGANINLSGVGTGNVIRNNHVFNTRLAGLRTDDNTWESLWLRNVNENCTWISKCENYWVNNIVIDAGPKNTANWGDFLQSRYEKNIIVSTSTSSPDFWTMEVGDFNDFESMATAVMDRNIYYRTSAANGPSPSITTMRQSNPASNANSLFVNPLFTDLAGGDFRLAQSSPAHALKIQSIDVREAGLLTSYPLPYRGTIPATMLPEATRDWQAVEVLPVVTALLAIYGPGGTGEEVPPPAFSSIPVADYLADFPQSSNGPTSKYSGTEALKPGWAYLWNPGGAAALGNPASFQALQLNTNTVLTGAGAGSGYPVLTAVGNVGSGNAANGDFQYGRVQPIGTINPGRPTGDFRAILAYTVQPGDDGDFFIEASSLRKAVDTGGNGVDLEVYLNGTLIPAFSKDAFNSLEASPFNGPLGILNAGDTIHVTVGNNGNQSSDECFIGYRLSRQPSGPLDQRLRAEYGLKGISASVMADPDLDGLANGFELLLRGHPGNPANRGGVMSVQPGPDRITIRFVVDSAVHGDLDYILETNDRLDGTWLTHPKVIMQVLDRGDGTTEASVTLPAGEATLFARLRMLSPP